MFCKHIGAQLFIEFSIIITLQEYIPLHSNIQLNEQQYTHIGCIVYHRQHFQISVGHYTAYVRNGTNWIEYDDLLRKPKKVSIKTNSYKHVYLHRNIKYFHTFITVMREIFYIRY